MKINAGPSGREVISLQKADSLLVLVCNGELKGICYIGPKEFEIKTFKMSTSGMVIIKVFEVFSKDE